MSGQRISFDAYAAQHTFSNQKFSIIILFYMIHIEWKKVSSHADDT